MEYGKSTATVDQLQVRGQYEERITDTAHLAAELSASQDLARLTADFDDGNTPLRDVGRMNARHRKLILDLYQERPINDIATDASFLFTGPVANLHDRVVWGDQDQPVGHNFFVNATGFLDAGLPWARQLNELMRTRSGASIYDIARDDDMAGKDRLLAAITDAGDADPELMATLGVYLAGRSLEGEKYLEQHYGDTLQRAKGKVFATTQQIGATTGLRIDMLERAAGQLQRAAFGSFDHLEGLVTSDNTGTAGDYRIGSLRIEVKFDGSVRQARVRDQQDALWVIAHELEHATSAQEGGRCGLQANGEGLEANEGMTEYLAQLSLGTPGIERRADGSATVRATVPYRAPVFAMFALHEQFKAGKNDHFAVLFNAYHGDVKSTAQLEQALDAFYQHDIAITQLLGS